MAPKALKKSMQPHLEEEVNHRNILLKCIVIIVLFVCIKACQEKIRAIK